MQNHLPPKTITLCGSMRAVGEMIECAEHLTTLGIATLLPTLDEPVDYSTLPESERAVAKSKLIRNHLDKIRASDAVLICNTTLASRRDYIGANSFLEMGFAFAFGKRIYLLNDIPEQPNTDEIVGMLPISIKGNLANICN